MILAKYLGIVEFKKGNDFKVYCLDTNMKIEIEKAVSEVINSGNIDKTKELLNILDEGSLSASQRGNGFIFITLIITCTMSASSIALVMALFGGAFLPIEKMPNLLKLLSNISPTKWIIGITSSMEKGIIYGNNLIVLIFIILLSSVIVFISSKIGEKKLKY